MATAVACCTTLTSDNSESLIIENPSTAAAELSFTKQVEAWKQSPDAWIFCHPSCTGSKFEDARVIVYANRECLEEMEMETADLSNISYLDIGGYSCLKTVDLHKLAPRLQHLRHLVIGPKVNRLKNATQAIATMQHLESLKIHRDNCIDEKGLANFPT